MNTRSATKQIIAVIAVLVAASACGPRADLVDKARDAGMNDAQILACEDLINGQREVSASDSGGKIELARKVNQRAQSIPELKDAGDALAKAAPLNADSWKLALDGFAGKCIQLGWPTTS